MNKIISVTGGVATSYLVGSYFCKKYFPPNQTLPSLPPEPGYKVYGYMGCPKSKVEAIGKRERLLFFTNEIYVAQKYALSRTSIFSRLRGLDDPVVLQLEIPENADIRREDLWNDPILKSPPTPALVHIAFHPAIPPEIQTKCDLKVRIHHIITCENQKIGGANCRAFKFILRELFHN